MTMGPWAQRAASATGSGQLRASDADREQVIVTLKDAFVQGRLTRDELGMRAGLALVSRTYADLTAITADIPVPPIAPPRPKPARVHTRKPVNKKAVACAACMIILPPVVGAAFLTFYGGFVILLVFAFAGLVATAGPHSY